MAFASSAVFTVPAALAVRITSLLRGVQDKRLWAQYLAGAVIDYHLPLREGRFGTWAAGPFLSYALYLPPEGLDVNGWEDTMAYGIGLFYYLKKVAFPGIGILAGKNDDFSGSFVSVQIGFARQVLRNNLIPAPSFPEQPTLFR